MECYTMIYIFKIFFIKDAKLTGTNPILQWAQKALDNWKKYKQLKTESYLFQKLHIRLHIYIKSFVSRG